MTDCMLRSPGRTSITGEMLAITVVSDIAGVGDIAVEGVEGDA